MGLFEPKERIGDIQKGKAPLEDAGKTSLQHFEEDIDIVRSALTQRGELKQQAAFIDDLHQYDCFIVVVFQSEDQKTEFLRRKGWAKYGEMYLDGMQIAEHENIRLLTPVPPYREPRPPNRKLAELALPISEVPKK